MGLGDWGRDGSLAYLRTAVEKSLRNLGVEAIDLYQYHRPDRWKTYAEVGAFGEIATAHGVSPQQVVLAWELSLGEHVIPIPGARRAASITDSAQAPDLELTPDELARCSAAVGLDRAD